MHAVTDFFSNKALLCGAFAWFVSQMIKGLTSGFRFHEWSLKTFLNSGGMPSSHTAAVVALTMMIGFKEGFGSSFFAISAVFALVVMYDAAGVRRETGKQGKIIKELLSISGPDGKQIFTEELKEKIGHTPLEVIMGAVMGILCSLLFSAF